MRNADDGDDDWGWDGWSQIIGWVIVGLAFLILFTIACSIVLAFANPTP